MDLTNSDFVNIQGDEACVEESDFGNSSNDFSVVQSIHSKNLSCLFDLRSENESLRKGFKEIKSRVDILKLKANMQNTSINSILADEAASLHREVDSLTSENNELMKKIDDLENEKASLHTIIRLLQTYD